MLGVFELTILVCAFGHALCQIAAHVLCYPLPLHRTARYAIGIVLFGIWYAFGAYQLPTPLTAAHTVALFWGIVLPAGALVIVAYWLRRQIETAEDRAFEAGRASAEEWNAHGAPNDRTGETTRPIA